MGFVQKADLVDLIFRKEFEIEEHDQIVRCFFTYRNYINIERLEHSLSLLLKELPILNSVFQEDNGTFYWVEREDESEIFFVHDNWNSFYKDWTYSYDYTRKPQFKINMYMTYLGFCLNNMVADVFGLKTIIARLCEIYNHYDEENYKPKYNHILSRKFADFIKKIPLRYKMKKIFKIPLSNKGFNEIKYDFAKNGFEDEITDTYINVNSIYKGLCKEIFEIAKKQNVLVSTVLATSYVRTIANTTKKYNVPINFGLQLDGRSEIPNEKYYVSVNNLHAILPIVVHIKENETFNETLSKVKTIIEKIKKKHLIALKMSKNIKHIWGNTPYFQFCNIGDGSLEEFSFKDNELMQLFFLTACRNIPFFSLTVGYFNEQIFYSTANFINEKDKKFVTYVNNWFKYELETFVHQNDKNFFLKYNENDDYLSTYNLPDIFLKDSTLFPELNGENLKNKNDVESMKDSKKNEKNNKIFLKGEKKNEKANNDDSYVWNDLWNEKQNELAKQYFFMTKTQLSDAGENKVKYKVNGKNTFQKRSWDEIEKFIQYKKKK